MAATSKTLGGIKFSESVVTQDNPNTTDAKQTITGEKTFSGGLLVSSTLADSLNSNQVATTAWVRTRMSNWWSSEKSAFLSGAQTVSGSWSFSNGTAKFVNPSGKSQLYVGNASLPVNANITTATADRVYGFIYLSGANNSVVGRIISYIPANTTSTKTQYQSVRTVGNTTYYHGYSIEIDSNGAATYYLSTSPADSSNGNYIATTAWVRTRMTNFLNALNNVTQTATAAGFNYNLSEVATNAANPSVNRYVNYGMNAVDHTWLGGMQITASTSGTNQTYILARKNVNGTVYSAGVTTAVNSSGVRAVALSGDSVTAPTPDSTDNSTKVATTAYAQTNWGWVTKTSIYAGLTGSTQITIGAGSAYTSGGCISLRTNGYSYPGSIDLYYGAEGSRKQVSFRQDGIYLNDNPFAYNININGSGPYIFCNNSSYAKDASSTSDIFYGRFIARDSANNWMGYLYFFRPANSGGWRTRLWSYGGNALELGQTEAGTKFLYWNGAQLATQAYVTGQGYITKSSLTDYVIAQKTYSAASTSSTAGGGYRVWNSGTVEEWGTCAYSSAQMTVKLYYTNWSAIDVATATVLYDNATQRYICVRSVSATNATITLEASGAASGGAYHFHVIGRKS